MNTDFFQSDFAKQSVLLLESEWNKLNIPDKRQFAYILGTVWHKTAHLTTMKEAGSDEYLHSKSYWPWIGRGFVQITHPDNYRRIGLLIGVDLIKNPEKAEEPETAAIIAVKGMVNGWFTGAKLSRYFNQTTEDWINSRRIINILDKADVIAGYAKQFLTYL